VVGHVVKLPARDNAAEKCVDHIIVACNASHLNVRKARV
jgi:hypothetical protein